VVQEEVPGGIMMRSALRYSEGIEQRASPDEGRIPAIQSSTACQRPWLVSISEEKVDIQGGKRNIQGGKEDIHLFRSLYS
jgi:hypothetical protein